MTTRYPGGLINKSSANTSLSSASGMWSLPTATQKAKLDQWPVGGVSNPLVNSLRFRRSASAYLTKTPASAGDRQKFTWSVWVKRGAMADLTSYYIHSSGPNTSSDRSEFLFTGEHYLCVGFNVSGTWYEPVTSAVFRDPSAWYHVVAAVDTTQATDSNRVKIYVNGVQQTLTGTYPPQNSSTSVNNTVVQAIGYYSPSSAGYYDGYMSEYHFIGGQQLTPASFGQTNPITGVWESIKYTGSYGTNGFYLPFKTPSNMGRDESGNNNNWTMVGFNTSTANTTYDVVSDVPTQWTPRATTTDTGGVVRGNYATLNPIANGDWFASSQTLLTLTNGNLSYGTGGRNAFGSFGVSSGKWYWECVNTSNTGTAVTLFGLVTVDARASVYGVYYQPNGNKGLGTLNSGASETSYGATWTDNDVIGVALDMDAATPTVTYYKNGSSQGSISVSSFSGKTVVPWIQNGANSGNMSGFVNFGQRAFSYSVPSGYKTLNTTNLPEPTIKQPNQYFDVTLYTGTGATQTITNSGSMQPDLVWAKVRSTTGTHVLTDSVRGANKQLFTNLTSAEASATNKISGFTTSGFTLAADDGTNTGDANYNGSTYVAWQWKEGSTPGFDIISYSGDSTNRSISHNCGSTPKMIIVKSRSGSTNGWYVYHHSSAGGDGDGLFLNNTAAVYDRVNDLGGTGITAANTTHFTATTGTGTFLNTSGTTYIAYCFAEIAGYSKFGSFTGNGTTDGPFIYCGFRPKYVMIKKYSSGTASNWRVNDSVRSAYNVTNQMLSPSSNIAEVNENDMDILSSGFKMRSNTTYTNGSDETYIFAAFAEHPFKNALAR